MRGYPKHLHEVINEDLQESIYEDEDLKLIEEMYLKMEQDSNWRFWQDTITKQKFYIDFDTSEGINLANDPSKNLVRITEKEFRRG